MIDYENRIYSGLKKALDTSSIGKVSMSTDLSASPTSFPHIAVCEADNSVYDKTIDSGSNENHVKAMYEINIYSNHKTARKTEAKKIFDEVDKYMATLGFTRISKVPIGTQSLFRIVARYQGIISKKFEIYRR